MKILRNLICFLLLLPVVSIAQDQTGQILSISEITVKQGHEAQFLQAAKQWKECYLKNKGTDHWSIWRRVQGKGGVYAITSTMTKWADMDKRDPASSDCRSIAKNFIIPNVESTDNSFAKNMPEFNRVSNDSMNLVWVTYFSVKNSSDFMDVVKDVVQTFKSSGSTVTTGTRLWYEMEGGGPESPQYMAVAGFKSFAELDKNNESVWVAYEKLKGKKATDAIRTKFRNSVDRIWSYLYTLEKDLSN